ncbi:hypothetical protein APHAL10511_000949 [Amanita phalloides]|nr:hypothetical protein APHAL10511_000949 [Amanita phalloides]
MNEDLETLVLSGKLFGNQYPSSSPVRTPSPDSGWHDEELQHRRITPTKLDNEKDDDGDSDQRGFGAGLLKETTAKDYIGMGPGRTGVKGVIRDRNEAVSRERERQRREIEEMNYKMEKSALGGKTYLEEEREKARDPNFQGKVDELILKEREQTRASNGEKEGAYGQKRKGRFGHLREVGVEGFVDSIDEDKGVWVLVHIYDQSLERCYDIDDILVQLARLHPDTKFLRASASALGFACTTKPSSGTSHARHQKQYLNTDFTDEKNYESEDEVGVDLDMLPTLLAYRDGELVHNWVRVDWEAGPLGLKDLFERHKILPLKRAFDAFPVDGLSDDDDGLQWSDLDDL